MPEWIVTIICVVAFAWFYWRWVVSIDSQKAFIEVEENIERWKRVNELNGAMSVHIADGWREYNPDYYGVLGMYGAKK